MPTRLAAGQIIRSAPQGPIPPATTDWTPLRTIQRGVRRLLRAEENPKAVFLTVVFISLFRLVLDHNSQRHAIHPQELLPSVTDRLTFYTASFLIFSATLRRFLPGRPPGVSNIVSVGLLFGLLPPLLAGLMPPLGPARYGYLTGWQLHFYAPGEHALAGTLTVWSTVIAAGIFVAMVSRSAWRAAGAMAFAWGGLAWTLVVLPSWILGAPSRRADTETWELQLTLAATCILIFLLSHRPLAGTLARRIPKQMLLLAASLGPAMLLGASGADVSFHGAFLLLLLIVGARSYWVPPELARADSPHPRLEPQLEAWTIALTLLLSLNVFLFAPVLALWGLVIFILRIARSSVEGPRGLGRFAAAALDLTTVGCGFFLSSAVPAP